ncbi:MAG: PKD domain-containing protein, partial [Saprospiraceae bacterium]
MTYSLKALLLTFSLFCFGTFAKAQNNDFNNTAATTQNTICENTAVGFTPIPLGFDTNFGAIDSVRWNFGDNPDWVFDHLPYGIGYVYTTAGVYTVTAVVYYASGITDTITKVNLITVNSNPIISFTSNPNSGCQPLDVQFNPSTTSSSTNGWTWTWTFSSDSICFAGDGRDTIIRTNANSFSNTFTEDGIYDVKLLVENQLGCRSDTTAFNVFTVEPKPIANFTAQIQPDCDATTNVVFTSTSSLPCTPSPMYNWNFGDGIGSITTALPTHTYEYLTSGTFTVQLIVTDGIVNGCADTTTQTITIVADPTVSIQAPNTACATEAIQFNGSSSGTVTSWAWNFGDGNTSNIQNPIHTYANPGCFTPSLTVTIDSCSFTTVFDTCIIINPKPSGTFSSLEDFETCNQPHTMSFTSTVIGTLTPIYAWDFGDGTTSSDQNPTKTWTDAGSYPISLAVSSPQGCISSIIRDTVIIDSIEVSFNSNIVGGCEPIVVQFFDNSTSFTGVTGWLWRFGDGNTSTQQNPTHTYLSSGTYDVELVIMTAQGCSDSLMLPGYINVGTPPTLNFTVSDNAPCINENISFINNSDPSGTNWLWFNGLDTVSGFNIPDTFYSASGSYDVWLSAESGGCIDTVFQNSLVNVTDLEVNIGTDGDCEVSPTGIDFSDNSTGTVINWYWDFGVDGITNDTSTLQNPSYIYPTIGEYVATLTITDASGCTLTDSTTINLDPPVANFGWTTDTVECVSIDFPVAIIDSSENNNGRCRWTLPDEVTLLFGSTDSICEPIFSFDTVGVYDLTLVVRSDQGCLDTITKQICATDVTAVGDVDTTGGSGGLIESPVSFINNGNPIVGGSSGCIIQIDSLTGDTTYITAIGTTPVNCNDPNLSLYTGCAPLTVEFSDSSFGFPDSIVSYVWDFGDGNFSNDQNPTHIYDVSSGEFAYMVTLTVINEFGVVNTDTIPSFIRPTQPISNFSISRDTVCSDLTVTSADSSSGFDLSYHWDFGNGDTSIASSPSFSYTMEGTYQVCLTVTDINGCDSILCDSIVVLDPVANFGADTTYSECENLTVTFTDSSENAISWLWLFGNDSTSVLQNPAVVYSGTGSYDLTLIAEGTGGCQDTLTVSNFVQVDGPSLSSMSVSPTDSCEDHQVGFNIQGSNIGIVTIEFGDGNDTTFGTFTSLALDTTIYYVYDTAGIYNPVLRIEDSLNCERVFDFNIIRTTDPLASFTVDTTLGCIPLAVTVDASASLYANQYEWIAPGAFIAGQGTTTPSFIYQNEGYYNEITLVVTDVNSCTDTLSFTDTITAADAYVGFYPDNYSGCHPLTVHFTDTSYAFPDTIVSWQWDFVNNGTSTLQNPSYTYDGAVNVNQRARLTVTSSYGCTDVLRQNVLPTFPTAAFIADSLACTEQTVNFTNQSTGLNLSYLWDFGDDSTSTDANPTHFYETEDTFQIILTVTDVNGCVDIDTLERIIVADPVANFTSDKIFIACAPDSVQFTDLSQNAIAWNWSIEGANPDNYNVQNPTVGYLIPGVYDVELIITSPS